MTDIEALILDFGNVMTLPQDRRAFNAMRDLVTAAAVGDAERPSFRAAYEAPRARYDQGDLEAGAYWAAVCGPYGFEPDEGLVEELRRLDVESWFRIDPAMLELLSRKRDGIRHLALLSNMNEDGVEALRAKAEWIDLFDLLVLSCEHGVVKPGREIYGICLDGLGVEAGRALFIDDVEANVAGARAAGLHAHRYDGVQDLEALLGGSYRLLA
jgi:putative hydrolase of the HAD superfamily